MATPLQPLTINSPAFYGLNTQDSAPMVDEKFARVLENCIIDEDGQIGSRKGWTYIAESSSVDLKGMHRFVDIDGAEYFGAWSDTGFYMKNGAELTSVTYSGSQTISEGNWQAATLNDAAFLFQRGYEPIYFNPTTGVLDDVSALGKGTPPEGNTVLSAYDAFGLQIRLITKLLSIGLIFLTVLSGDRVPEL